ncbi:MAG: FkbM family methyltransferase [Atribacterota bacterium]
MILSLKRNIKWIKILKKNKGKLLETKVLGKKMYIDISKVKYDIGEESIAKQLALDGIREPVSTVYFRKYIKDCEVFLDIGANIGYYTLIAAEEMKKDGIIYAVEPSDENIELLKKNIFANGYGKMVKIHKLAFSDKKGEVNYFVSSMSNLNTTYNSELVHKKQVPFLKRYKVKSTTVDKFLEDNKKPEFIKMDIEGAEVDVIKGMKKTLRAKKKIILFIEIHPQLLTDTSLMQDLLRTLKKNGFRIKVAVSHDDFYRNAVDITRIENISIDELIRDRRIVDGTTAFEVFFEKSPHNSTEN